MASSKANIPAIAVAQDTFYVRNMKGLASSNNPTVARMIFYSLVMVSSDAPGRGASPPPTGARPQLAIRHGDPGHLLPRCSDGRRTGNIWSRSRRYSDASGKAGSSNESPICVRLPGRGAGGCVKLLVVRF